MRVGLGFDVHRLVKGEDLIIGGIHIPFAYGLLGHSDADVLTHALMDALLGALGKGDIGALFPDTDPAYKGSSSLCLLEQVRDLMLQEGYRVHNIDLILIAEEPKIFPYAEEIIANYCRVLELEREQLNLKATTTEGLGFVGRREGIAAQAIVSLVKDKDGDEKCSLKIL